MLEDGVAVAQTAVARRQQTISTVTTSSYTTPTPATARVTGIASTTSRLGVVANQSLGPDSNGICTAALPAGGVIEWNETYTQTLYDTLPFQAPCDEPIFRPVQLGNQTVIPPDPFYASFAPQFYALATATVISYLLVVILLITPRTFILGGPTGTSTSSTGGAGLLSRGMTFVSTGSSRSSGVVGVGQRPLLQKIATITVAVSLTIATADTFTEAAIQYHQGVIDAGSLVEKVVGSLEIKITRVISDTFLWLAQVQTLIRLFPRHKEKVTIKWLGFVLVVCDTVFSILENFASQVNRTRIGGVDDPIPALSYLFELSISLIYASCVIYYSLSKRRFAFWHAKMRNVLIVAVISLSAVMIPVVFFIVDIAQPNIATWGEYIRWVGSAAASVVVWEWVERIEALERDEKKDGILGREIYDGDEMIDTTPSEDMDMDSPTAGNAGVHFGSGPKEVEKEKKGITWKNVRELSIHPQLALPVRRKKGEQKGRMSRKQSLARPAGVAENGITRPQQAATPISRSDTNSAASTVYAVRYHNPLSPSPAIPEGIEVTNDHEEPEIPKDLSDDTTLTNTTTTTNGEDKSSEQDSQIGPSKALSSGRQIWHGVANPFKRKRAEPPAEIAAQIADSNMRRSPGDRPFSLRSRFDVFAAHQKERIVGRTKVRTPLQVTVIPAQPRGSRVRESISDPNDQTSVSRQPDKSAPGANMAQSGSAEVSGENTPRRASLLPVTVIPAPVRGGRTWSPDDLENETEAEETLNRSTNDLGRADRAHHGSPSTVGRRTTLSQHQSPMPSSLSLSTGRLTGSPNAGQSLLRTPDFGRNRAATATSLSERMGESPVTVLGPTPESSSSPSSNGRRAGDDGPRLHATSWVDGSLRVTGRQGTSPPLQWQPNPIQVSNLSRRTLDADKHDGVDAADYASSLSEPPSPRTATIPNTSPNQGLRANRPGTTTNQPSPKAGNPPTPSASGPGRP